MGFGFFGVCVCVGFFFFLDISLALFLLFVFVKSALFDFISHYFSYLDAFSKRNEIEWASILVNEKVGMSWSPLHNQSIPY